MQGGYRFLELCDLHHSEGTAGIPDTDVSNAGALVVEGLPIIRL